MIRIRWSEIPKHKPIQVVINLNHSKLYIDNKYILLPAMFDFKKYGRSFELSVPFSLLLKEIESFPIKVQSQFKNGRVSFELTKLDKGKMKIDKINQYEM